MPTASRLRFLVLALAFTLPLAGCGDKSPESLIEAAKLALQKSDNKAAIIELKSALQQSPDNAEARLLLGQALQTTGDWPGSEKELRKAIELGGQSELALPLLAKTLINQGKYKDVTELEIPAAILTSSSIASVQAEKANAFLGLNNPMAALSAINEGDKTLAAVGGNGFSNDLQLAKARLALVNNQPAQANVLLDSVLQRDAKSVDALYLKARLLLGTGKTAAALAEYQKLISAKPDEIQAHLAIAEINLRGNDLVAAEKALQAAEKVDAKNPMVRYVRGIFELGRGNLEKADSALLDVLRISPDHLPSQMAYAMVTYGLGRYEQSSKAAGKVFAANPVNLEAAKVLAGSQLMLGDIQGALKTLQPLLSKHAEDAQMLALAGQIYLQAKDYNKAQAYLDKAASLDPESASIKTQQAASQLAAGNSNAALANLESATRLSNKPGLADISLVMLHIQNKQYDQALQAIAKLEKKTTNNPVIHNLRAGALLGKQDRAGARKELEAALKLQPSFFSAAINLARMDMQDGKPEVARKRFEAILATDQNNVQAMLALADLAAAEKRENDAVAWLEKAVKADPKALPAYKALILFYLNTKENAKALAQAKLATDANPDSLAALNMLGGTQLATGKKDAAIDTYTRLSHQAPQSPEAYRLLAIAQAADKQIGAARDSLKTALKLKLDFLPAQESLMRLELADNKPDAALAIARQIQSQLPKSPLGFDLEADIRLLQKHYPQAIKSYQEALTKGAGTAGLIKLHRALRVAGDDKAADRQLADWIKQHPKDLAARNYAAEFYMLSKRNREAIALYEQLLKAKPDTVIALNNLASLYQREKDSRALATAEQALKLAPDQPSVQNTLGWILVEQGQLPRGLDLLGKAATKSPKEGVLRYHYGVALARSGKKVEAKKELEAAIASGQKFPELEDAKVLLKNL
jgi:putative PEP-CTERM system TPR-repeat lipoprotein